MKKELIDHVWKHCLPKEFKEEVRRHFFKKNAQSPLSIECDVLCKYFGHHNLTSDAEGEEVLTVSRKEIQKLVAANDTIILKSAGIDSIETIQAKTVNTILNRLFGSKCLPDEPSSKRGNNEPKFKYKEGDKVVRYCDGKVYVVVDYCEDDNVNYYIIIDALGNRYSDSEGNLKLYEGPKYHIGQKVRHKGQNHEIGEIVEYWGDEDPGRYSVRFGKEYHNISENMLESYEEPKPAEPKYHKGDKVRYNGYVYEIEGYVGKNRYALKGLNFDLDEDMIEPYTEPTEEASPNVNNSDIDIEELVAKGYVPDPAQHFDNILKDGFREHNRLHIAATIAAGWLAYHGMTSPETIAMDALAVADALIKECEKGGSK